MLRAGICRRQGRFRFWSTTTNRVGVPSGHYDPAVSARYVDTYGHDVHGSITAMPGLAGNVWDAEDQLVEVALGGGGDVYYSYDGGGERVRKVIRRQNGTEIVERLYLDGWEIYRRHLGAVLDEEIETLHVMDDQRRLSLVETKTITGGAAVAVPVPRPRYQLEDHLGTCSVELDGTAQANVLTYEEYFPYGATAYRATAAGVDLSPKRYRYTTKERDEETGLDYFGARYYICWLGRWLSADPAGFVDGVNLYQAMRSNPVSRVDIDGMNSVIVRSGDTLAKIAARTPSPDDRTTDFVRSKPISLSTAGDGRLMERIIGGRIQQGDVLVDRRELMSDFASTPGLGTAAAFAGSDTDILSLVGLVNGALVGAGDLVVGPRQAAVNGDSFVPVLYVPNSGADLSSLSPRQQHLRSVLESNFSAVGPHQQTAVIQLRRDDPTIIFGRFPDQAIDVADFEMVRRLTPKDLGDDLIADIFAHELIEQDVRAQGEQDFSTAHEVTLMRQKDHRGLSDIENTFIHPASGRKPSAKQKAAAGRRPLGIRLQTLRGKTAETIRIVTEGRFKSVLGGRN